MTKTEVFIKARPPRVWNCAFLVANTTKNFVRGTRSSQLVDSGRLTIAGHDNIQTITLIFSQIDSSKIHICPPSGHLHVLFTFPLLVKYKTDFAVIINLPQRFITTISAKLRCQFFFSDFPKCTYDGWFRGVEWEVLHGCGLVQATWWSVDHLDRMQKERLFWT